MKFEITQSHTLYNIHGDITRRWISRDQLMGVLCRVLFDPRPDNPSERHTYVDETLVMTLEWRDGFWGNGWLIRRGDAFSQLVTPTVALAACATQLYTGTLHMLVATAEQHQRIEQEGYWGETLDIIKRELIGGQS